MKITLDVAFFNDRPARIGEPGLGRFKSEKGLLWLLEALVNINRAELRDNDFPPLYRAGIRYLREPKGREIWKDVAKTFQSGHGDCEDLACWRVAELRNNGKRAQPYIRYRIAPGGMLVYHVMVLRANGKLEDPSKVLGMKGSD